MIEELERRILLSADTQALLGVGLAHGDPGPAAEHASLELEAAAATRRELVFVDPGVAGWQALVKDLRAGGTPGRALEVLVLDPSRDGVDQIGEVLRTQGDLDAVHVVAHGGAGALRLGDGWLDAARLARSADAIAGWGDALGPDGDLLLYGCDLAASPQGASLLDALARLTGADVAASADATGSVLLGGNWELEVQVGAIEARVPFSEALRAQWSGLLSIETLADDFASGGYAGNTGTDAWQGPWREIGELTDPSSGVVQVAGGALRIGGNLVSVADRGIVREADLDGVIQATLRFDYRRQNLGGAGGSVMVQVSRDGAAWATLATYNLNGSTDGSFIAQSFDMTAWAGPETQIRFLGTGTARGYLYVDNVAIEYTRTLYLKGDGVPGASLSIVVPPAVALPNYDPGRDAFPGLVIDKGGSGIGETDAAKHQIWRAPVDGVDVVDARVQFTFHSAMKDFQTGKRGAVTAYLVDAFGSTLTPIASATLQVDDWGDGGWQQFTVDFGDVTYDLAPGHRLAVKLIVNNSSQDSLWFAYDTQTHPSQLVFLPSTPSTSTGAAVWATNTGVPQVSLWNGSAFGPQTGSANLDTPWRIIQGAEAPTRDERIVAGVDTSGVIRAQIWNGSTWSALPMNPLDTMSTSAYWGVDVAYESQSGDGMLVWANGTTGLASVSYSVWNGSTWTAPAAIAVPVLGAAHQLELAASPNSDEMVLIVSTAGSLDYALVWNGSSWGNAIALSTSGTGNDRTDVYVAYEQQSGHAMVVYGKGTTSVFYRMWNGTSWGAESSLAAPLGASGNARWTTLAADPNSDRIALGVLTYNAHVWLAVWNGSAWQSPVLASTSASSATSPGVAVAFESTTGQALAVYTASGSPYTRFRTWSPTTGWSGAAVGTFVGNVPRSVMLDADPVTDDIMLSIVDDGADFNLARWNGAGWSERTELSTNTFETGLQPFLFMWDRKLNAPPVLDLPGGNVAYVENDPATILDGAATLTDPDSPNFAGGTLTVRFAANGTADDRLGIRSQGPGIGNVTISGSTVSYDFGSGPVAIGTFAGGGSGSTPLVVTFNANATATAVQAVARNVTYRNVSDAPSTASRTVEMVATDGSGGTSAPAYKTVDVTAVNDPPDLADAGFSLPENSANGTLVGTVTATDPDVVDVFTYAITGGNAAGAFAIHPSTGAITVANAAALDFETTPSFTLTVQVTDAGGLSDTATVTIALTDVNEPPVLGDASFSLPENSANGTPVGTVAATDPDAGDTRTYAITAGNTGGAFAIHPTTGAITVANAAALDFETTPSFALTVQVTDAGGLTDTATVTVTLTDVNEAPSLADASFTLPENSAHGTLVGAVAATDPDAGDVLGYAITAGNASGAFAIDPVTGAITVANAAALDFETTPSFALTVQVTDAGGLTDTATVTVTLTDVNEAPSLADASFSLPEHSANGTLVGAIAATDPDAGEALGYTIVAGNTGGAFAIDPVTGAIRVANAAALDFETTPSFTLTVQVTDAGGLTDTATVTVTLTNVNEAPSLADASFSLPENSAHGTLVGAIAATDPDAGDAPTYAITAGNASGAFAIDPTTGVITVANAAALDFETTPSFTLTVQVTDAGGLTDTATVTVVLANVNEAASLADASFSLPENSPNGTLVGSVAATDPDAGETFTYAITAGNAGGAFAIDPVTGSITVANAAALDFETAPTFTLTVRVMDAGGLTDTATVTVNLVDVNERPVFGDVRFTLPENSADGTLVGAVVAVDRDAGDTVRYAILGGNTGGAFAIDPVTGAITVANAAALDFETTPTFTLTIEAADESGAARTATITVSLRDVVENGQLVDGVQLEELPVHDRDDRRDDDVVDAIAIPPMPRMIVPPPPNPVVRAEVDSGGSSGHGLEKLRSGPEIWQPAAAEDGQVRNPHGASLEHATMIDQRRLLEALDRLRQELRSDRSAGDEGGFTLSVKGVALMISSGLLALLMRGGWLAAAALSALPLWRRVDPLAVLALSEEERWQRQQDIRAAQHEEESGRLLDGTDAWPTTAPPRPPTEGAAPSEGPPPAA